MDVSKWHKLLSCTIYDVAGEKSLIEARSDKGENRVLGYLSPGEFRTFGTGQVFKIVSAADLRNAVSFSLGMLAQRGDTTWVDKRAYLEAASKVLLGIETEASIDELDAAWMARVEYSPEDLDALAKVIDNYPKTGKEPRRFGMLKVAASQYLCKRKRDGFPSRSANWRDNWE